MYLKFFCFFSGARLYTYGSVWSPDEVFFFLKFRLFFFSGRSLVLQVPSVHDLSRAALTLPAG